MCTRNYSFEDLNTIHHELGHIQYQMHGKTEQMGRVHMLNYMHAITPNLTLGYCWAHIVSFRFSRTLFGQ